MGTSDAPNAASCFLDLRVDRSIIGSVGGKAAKSDQLVLFWVLNLSDGNASVLDIAERSRLSFAQLRDAIEALAACGLLDRMPEQEPIVAHAGTT